MGGGGRKKENEKLAFYGTNFSLFQIWLLCKMKFLIPMVNLAPLPVLLAMLCLLFSPDHNYKHVLPKQGPK
jgi:hypothetical protein